MPADPPPASPAAPESTQLPAPKEPANNTWLRRALTIRQAPSYLEGIAFGTASLGFVLFVWWFLTRGEGDQRIVNSFTLPSLHDTIHSFKTLWFDRELSISAVTSLARVLSGFMVSAAIAVPLGVISGSYLRVHAFLKPLSLFGRNVPIAALIPLTFIWFGLGEVQKVMFIFFATVAFVLFDTTNAVQAVPDRFLDTAYTLGVHRTPAKGARIASFFGLVYGLVAAIGWFMLGDDPTHTLGMELGSPSCWLRFFGAFVVGFGLWFPIESHQALRKVIFPLALPDIVNSLRLIFGLAFGYIMLAEVINAPRGLGSLIITSQRQGPREHIYLCLIIISIMAWGIDRVILRIQRVLFPYLKNGEA